MLCCNSSNFDNNAVSTIELRSHLVLSQYVLTVLSLFDLVARLFGERDTFSAELLNVGPLSLFSFSPHPIYLSSTRTSSEHRRGSSEVPS